MLIFALSLLFLIISLILNQIAVAEILPSDRGKLLQNTLWVMAGASGIMAAGLFVWLVRTVHNESKAHEEQLGQVRYMLEVEKKLFDAYREPELFMEALKLVAEAMVAEQAYFMVLKDSAIVRLYRWGRDGGGDSGKISREDANLRFPYLSKKSREEGNQILYDLEELKEKSVEDYRCLKSQGIENLVFTPVRGQDQKTVGILGAVNMKQEWNHAGRLECVALSFGMALNNQAAFQNVKEMGEMDLLTGLLNRNSFQQAKKSYGNGSYKNLACVFVDADGLHDVNNHLGHEAGDAMLSWIANCLKHQFQGQDIYRIGGDEFLAVCRDMAEKDVLCRLEAAQKEIGSGGYHVSTGMEWREDSFAIDEMTGEAERKMYEEKHRYYEKKGDVKQAREMNRILEGILREKKDADAFLSVLASNFKGVYFVNVNTDSIRSIYIPEYFKDMIKRAGGKYSAALGYYIDEMVAPGYREDMKRLLDYKALSKALENGKMTELAYEKEDGTRMVMKIYRSENDSEENREMIWLFSGREGA